jgi:SET domain-containing protein
MHTLKEIDGRFVVRQSPGKGSGLFALCPFKKGRLIAEYTGVRIPTPYADTLDNRYLFELDRVWTIDGSPESNVARWINHACLPNCEGVIRKGRIFIYAARDIRAGEELTIDYGEEYFDEFIRPVGCKCAECSSKVDRRRDPVIH